MKMFKNTSEGFEFSGRRAICLTHGFQFKTKTTFVPGNRDVFGFATDYRIYCLKCGKECKEELSTEFVEVD